MEAQELSNAVIVAGAFTDDRVSDCVAKAMLVVQNDDGDGVILISYPNDRQITVVLSAVTLETLSKLAETGKVS